MKTENVAESHQTDIPYTFPAGHETTSSPVLHSSAEGSAWLSGRSVDLVIRMS